MDTENVVFINQTIWNELNTLSTKEITLKVNYIHRAILEYFYNLQTITAKERDSAVRKC